MTLKMKIARADFDKLPDPIKAEYKPAGEEFQLDLDGYEDPAALRRARDHEKAEGAKAKQDLAAVSAKVAELEDKLKNTPADITEAEKRTAKKYEKDLATATSERDALKSAMTKRLVDTTALAVAERISTVPALLAKEIASRLTVDFTDLANPELVVIDSAGKPRGDLVGLEKEFLSNKDFAPILRGTKGSGGSAPTSPTAPGGGAPDNNPDKKPDLSKLSPAELAAYSKQVREARQQQGA